MAPVILLTTTVDWPFAARLASAFAQMRLRVEALAPGGHVLAKSRHVAAVHAYQPLAPQKALEHAIARAKPDLLIPCDDRALLQALAVWRRAEVRHDDEAASLIVRSFGNPALYERMMARSAFIADMRADGIRAPEMRDIESEAALEDALTAVGLPAVLKSDGSWGGDGVIIVHTRQEAREAWRKLSRAPSRARSLYRAARKRDLHRVAEAIRPPQQRVGLQAFVDGVPATSTFAARKGEVLATLHFDVVVSPAERGPASVVRRVEDPCMDMAVRQVAQRYKLSGLHGLDFVRDAAGKAHLIEINPRATPTSHLALGDGLDLVAALSSAFFSPRMKPRPAATTMKEIALFPQEWQRDPESMHLAAAHHDVPWDDPTLLHSLIGRQGAQALSGALVRPANRTPALAKAHALQGE